MKGEFYKMDYEAWDDGTFSLTIEQEGAYLRFCHMIYRKGGPVTNSERMLCAIWRCHQNKARSLFKALVDAGKIIILDDGKLTNGRATVELDARQSLSKTRAEAGQAGGIKTASVQRTQGTRAPHTPTRALHTEELPLDAPHNPLKNNGSHKAKMTEERRGEKIREEEKRESDASHPTRESASTLSEKFAVFWKTYPHKVGKAAAAKSFEKIAKAKKVTFLGLMAGVDSYIVNKPPDHQWCNPATWLNQGRWDDQYALPIIQTQRDRRNGQAQEFADAFNLVRSFDDQDRPQEGASGLQGRRLESGSGK